MDERTYNDLTDYGKLQYLQVRYLYGHTKESSLRIWEYIFTISRSEERKNQIKELVSNDDFDNKFKTMILDTIEWMGNKTVEWYEEKINERRIKYGN